MLHRQLRSLLCFAAISRVGMLVTPCPDVFAQETGRHWKDRAEYDVYAAARNENEPNKRLSLLHAWKQKYPGTDYQDERLQLYLLTYQQLGQARMMADVAREMLAANGRNLQALAAIVAVTPTIGNTSAEALEVGEKSARDILAMDRPQSAGNAEWENLKAAAHKTLGWVAMVRKQNETAEAALKRSLEINPNDAVQSYWLGLVILAQKKPDRQSEALFHFARAAAFEGAGELPAKGRQEIDDYLANAYASYHGSGDGLTDLKGRAKTHVFPPDNFTVESAAERAVRHENELREKDPKLALWLGIRKQLTESTGEQYFAEQMQGTAVPRLRGALIAMYPANRPRKLVLGIANPDSPEVTLVMNTALPGRVEVGTVLEFEGVPTAFVRDPFMVTFAVENDKLTGWPAPARGAVRKR